MIEVVSISGDELLCLCPFPSHVDKNPSLSMNLKKDVYYCFGCEKRGRATDLVSRFGKPTLCGNVGSGDETVSARAVNDPGMNYMKKRGYTKETIASFFISFDPEKHRVMIPIIDRSGHVWGTIGRTTIDEDPKYKYSYGLKISEVLFGIHKCPISSECIYVTEGALDAVWMHQNGFTSTVSILGSHMSDKQASMILNISRQVTLCFDNDEAGKKAAKRAFNLLKDRARVDTVVLPKEKNDVQECNKEELCKVLTNSMSYLSARIT